MPGIGKTVTAWAMGVFLVVGTASLPALAADPVSVTVYKSPTCGCCEEWIKHMRANGFRVDARDVPDTDVIKRRFGVPDELVSCHTAMIDGYVIEGHVPAATIRRLLRERPAVAGLAVPGMPASAPGMDSTTKEPYDVLAFKRDGRSSVYERH